MVQKAPGAYQTISEVSVQLDVPAHVLRFWESKFSVLKPLKRSGGRRYYRTEDIQLLKSIKSLLYDEGYTIKGAQNSLKKRTSASGSVQTNEAKQPSSLMRQSLAEAHLHKAESLLEEANKIVKTLLGHFDR
ncbi:MAG: transcriptional regulator [SAR116 cluster bacterium]|jgi:DNA-binding transcriptional MerR regulator|nr:transcriptional regulator [SAR116 cluster bacterium]RPG90454.1 MAG: MerR family transcriptional regulator [Candidatus Puniceispirillum sp. TMED213]